MERRSFLIDDMIRTPLNVRNLLAAMLLIGGCGFHPLYTSQNEGNLEIFSRIHINPIGDRIGQILRYALIDRMTPHGLPEVPHYALSVTLDVSTEPLHAAAHLIMSATYSIKDLQQNKNPVIFTSTGRSIITYYNEYNSSYEEIRGIHVAECQAAHHLADEIVERIAFYFSSVRVLNLQHLENTQSL